MEDLQNVLQDELKFSRAKEGARVGVGWASLRCFPGFRIAVLYLVIAAATGALLTPFLPREIAAKV